MVNLEIQEAGNVIEEKTEVILDFAVQIEKIRFCSGETCKEKMANLENFFNTQFSEPPENYPQKITMENFNEIVGPLIFFHNENVAGLQKIDTPTSFVDK